MAHTCKVNNRTAINNVVRLFNENENAFELYIDMVSADNISIADLTPYMNVKCDGVIRKNTRSLKRRSSKICMK